MTATSPQSVPPFLANPSTCLLAGFLAVLALPPVGFFPVLWVVLPQLLIACHPVLCPSPARAALRGWLWALGYFGGGLYWIGFALFVDPATYWPLMPLAFLGLPALLALYFAAAMALFRAFPGKGCQTLFRFVLILTVAEWLRGHLFTGFPWNLFAVTWATDFSLPLLQTVQLIGTYGLNALTVLLFALPVALLSVVGVKHRTAMGMCGASLTLFASLMGWGLLRLQQPSTPMPDATFTVVQSALPQRERWTERGPSRLMARNMLLSAEAPRDSHLIWPESAVPLPHFTGRPDTRALLSALIPPDRLLLTGTTRLEETEGERRIYNSLEVLDESGAVIAHYDKHHLVPFGESVPFRDLLNILPIAAGTLDFARGTGPRTLTLPGFPPVSPLICYEVIFPGRATAPDQRPEWMLNLTDDSWYGDTAGPHQHLALARMRAVEEGLPLIRAAASGISANIDPFGRIVDTIPYNLSAIKTMTLQKAQAPVVASKNHVMMMWSIVALLVFGSFVVIFNNPKG